MTMHSHQSFMSLLFKDKAIPRNKHNRLCCAKCRFSTKDTVLFQRHVAHHKEVTFSCALCRHVSFSKTESQKHVVSHTGSYPFRCSFCSYGAVRRDYIVKHIHRMHKRHVEKNIVTNFNAISPAGGRQSATNTNITSDWPDSTEHCLNPSIASQPNGNVCDKNPGVYQTRTSTLCVIAKPVSKTSSKQACFAHNTSAQSAANTTSGNRQYTGAIPSCVTDTGCTEPILKPLNVGVPEKTIKDDNLQVRLHADISSSLKPLLSMPMQALSQKSVGVQNVQTDPKDSQSAAGTNLLTAQNLSLGRWEALQPVKHSERSPLLSLLEEPATEMSNQPRTRPRILVASTEKSCPLSNVQVELLAPLNQPIQHNRPLTVSCPEEIHIPAGCLVELVEVKTVNGTRELELRLIPPNGNSQDLKGTVNMPSTNVNASKLSFKCKVSAGSVASSSKSSASVKEKLQSPLPCTNVQQSIRKTVHKPQCSSDTAVQTITELNQKSNSLVVRPVLAASEATEVRSEGLPVISSVFSLCPTPTSTQSISQFMAEFHNSTLQTNGPPKMVLDPEYKMAALNKSKENAQSTEQSMVCSIRIKKEEESQEKHKAKDPCLKETKTEHKSVEEITKIETCCQEKTTCVTTQNMSEKCSNLNTLEHKEHISDLKENPNVMDSPLTAVMLSNRDSSFLTQSKNEHSCRASLMYPKVALVRIPSLVLEPTHKIPQAEESLTARPVFCCAITKNVSRGGAIKLILKRNFPESKDQNRNAPSYKKSKKEKTNVMDFHSLLSKGHEKSRLTPLKEDQLIKLPSPNQPVVVLNHPNPLVEMVNVGVQTLKDCKWIQTEIPVRKQPSLKMKLKKIQGQKYQVIELVLRGVSEKFLS